LKIFPQSVTLWGYQASQQFVVQAKYATGLERDVTTDARLTLSDPSRGKIEPAGKFTAGRGGKVVLTARYGRHTAQTTLNIEDAEQQRPFSFARDIVGIFTKSGCNSSSCHGSVKGRAGFKLSINGAYPRDDHKWVVEG